MPPSVGVSQTVVVAGVGEREPTVGSLAASQGEGRVGETLHPPGHHDTPVTQAELGSGQTHCLQSTGADLGSVVTAAQSGRVLPHLVDGGTGRPSLQPRPQGCLASRGLAQPGLGTISVKLNQSEVCGSLPG